MEGKGSGEKGTAQKKMSRIAVFASGEGTNFEVIARACADGRIPAVVSLLVCDRPGAPVVDRARTLGVPCFAFSPRDYACKAEYEKEIVSRLDAEGVELVCLAGYMRIVSDVLLNAYEGRIINIHPSLLPAFPGARAVEQAVEYGVKVYGITIHYVNSVVDGGRIIAQKAFEYDGDDPAEVHRLGQKIEHSLYIDTINRLLQEK